MNITELPCSILCLGVALAAAEHCAWDLEQCLRRSCPAMLRAGQELAVLCHPGRNILCICLETGYSRR